MRTLFFLFLIVLFQSHLLADTRTVYDIRGSSPKLDSNMSRFLDVWRNDTITPIQNGTYCNICVNGNPADKVVTLTFDDAPDENNTDQLLTILDTYKIKASFFMIGGTMRDDNITAVKRAADEGHLVLSHSFNHPRLSDLNESAITAQLESASERIESITGHYPILFRPPYGSINPLVVDTINARGMKTVLWSLDSLDWALKDPDAVVENVAGNVRNGDIILMHRNSTSVASLSKVIDRLLSMGYTFQRLDEMLGIRAYR